MIGNPATQYSSVSRRPIPPIVTMLLKHNPEKQHYRWHLSLFWSLRDHSITPVLYYLPVDPKFTPLISIPQQTLSCLARSHITRDGNMLMVEVSGTAPLSSSVFNSLQRYNLIYIILLLVRQYLFVSL